MANNLKLLYYANKSYEELIDEILQLTEEKDEYIFEIECLEDRVEDLESDAKNLEDINNRLKGDVCYLKEELKKYE